MLVDITQQEQTIKQKNADLILKLICYHNLFGGVLGRDRDEQKIIAITHNQLELTMLFILGKADSTSIVIRG